MLTYTVYMLLQGLTNKLQVGDLDSCLDIMIEVRFRKKECHFLNWAMDTDNRLTKYEIFITCKNENDVLSHLLD